MVKCIEKRGLASIGVSDQGDDRNRDAFTALALLSTNAAHFLDLSLDVLDAAMNLAAVGFKLGFTRSAGANAAAELRHLHTTAAKPRQHVLKLRKLNLELAFTSARVAGKDIENQLGAIDHAAVEFVLQVAKLGGR